jgi:membrane associated rhomboid family serine protease
MTLQSQDACALQVGESLLPLAFRRVLTRCAASFAAAVAIAYVFAALFPLQPQVSITDYFFRTQDALWVIVIAGFLAVCAFLRFPTAIAAMFTAAAGPRSSRLATFALIALVFACGAAGSGLVFDNFHLSRDENLAEFDAQIFRSGLLIAPVDAEWRPFANALAPRFMLPIAGGLGFVSHYLPGNAVLRALVGMLGDSDLTGAILTAIAVAAAYGVARRLWPRRNDVAVLVPLLVATAPQTLVTSMTSYAMCAHLAFNLVWLWLFLRDDKFGHAGAMLVGVLACGLHQVAFHPLFVAPFIVSLWLKDRRPLAAIYAAVYALICLFWAGYPQLILSYSGMEPETQSGVGLFNFLLRAVFQLTRGEYNAPTMMLMNMLRFISWQNPLLLSLMILAYGPIRKGTGIVRELAAGLCLTICAMGLIMVSQGHGWGYRYLHGLIGSAALIGAYGWIDLMSRAEDAEAAATRTALAVSSALALFVLFPVHALQAHDFVAPYVRASAAIAGAPTDIVIVDQTGLRAGEDLVQNDPFLRNKPKILELTEIDEARLPALCRRYSISSFDSSQGRGLGITPTAIVPDDAQERREKLRARLAKMSCGKPLEVTP